MILDASFDFAIFFILFLTGVGGKELPAVLSDSKRRLVKFYSGSRGESC